MATERDLASLLERESPRHHSLALATVSPGGGGQHRAGREPPQERALFQIGSITKVFTALVLARGAVRGDWALETPVASLLPGSVRWPDGGADLTLGELATHTAGLPRLPPGMLGKALRRDPDPYADIDAASLERSLARVRIRHRGRPRYSNLGFGLLGHALATATGTSYDELVRAEVCEPLGLHDTAAHLDGDRATRVMPGHTRRLRPRPVAWDFDAMAGCGALWSSIEDLQRFVAAHLEPPDGEVGAAIRLAMEPRVTSRRATHGLAWLVLPRQVRVPGVFHNGGTYGYRSVVVVSPSQATGVAALTSTDRSVDGLAIQAIRGLSVRDQPSTDAGGV